MGNYCHVWFFCGGSGGLIIGGGALLVGGGSVCDDLVVLALVMKLC